MTLRLITFTAMGAPGASRVGVLLDDGRVLDLHAAAPNPATAACTLDMRAFIQAGPAALAAARASVADPPAAALLDAASIRLLAPIPRPRRNVFCVGRNYLDHVAEGDRAQGRAASGIPAWPQFFTKVPSAVIAHEAPIPSHSRLTRLLDYEAELALVIGVPGIDIARGQAPRHVYGWTIANDVTARDLQRRHVQFFKGKSLDGSCPLGPWIVPADELDASDLPIRLWVNGELRQDSRTSRMIFDVPVIVEQLSAGMALEAGDVILTGTPEGVGYAMQPPRGLRPRDRIEIEIEGLGRLCNTVADLA